MDGEVVGLDHFARADWPNVPIVFWSFRIMVGIGFLMLLYGLVGAVLAGRRRLFEKPLYLRWAVLMGPTGFLAILSGWFVSEIGRQPYVVYGLMRTSEAASPIGAPGVAASLFGSCVIYMIVFGAGTYYLLRLMKRPPDTTAHHPASEGPIRTGHPKTSVTGSWTAMVFDLPTIWAGIICIALLAYVLLDGFDLGIGILFPLGRDKEERDLMMNSVAPIWDGNQTWLVLGGGGLFAAFPLAYSILLTAFYAPLILMLLALVLRGVAFEFRFRSEHARTRRLWDMAFIGGSGLATFTQGLMVGAFDQGVDVRNGAYAGGWFDWLTPFTILCGLALIAGYALLGASWLVIKTEGSLQDRMRALQLPIGAIAILAVAVVSGGTLLQHEDIFDRWFSQAPCGGSGWSPLSARYSRAGL